MINLGMKFRNVCFFLHKNICCGCSIESPRGDSNDYPQDTFLWRTDESILELSLTTLLIYQGNIE